MPDDEAREVFLAPDYLRRMVEKGLLGRKSGGGFYKLEKKDGKKIFYTLDLGTLEYREKQKARFAEIEQGKTMDDLGERLRFLAFGKGKAGQAIWKILAATFSYSAMRVGEICDQAADIDRALRWGFNWELGPFETWDALGFRKVVERLRAGQAAPAQVGGRPLRAPAPRASTRSQDGALAEPHGRARQVSRRCRPTRAPGTSRSCAAATARSGATPAPACWTWARACWAWSSTPR